MLSLGMKSAWQSYFHSSLNKHEQSENAYSSLGLHVVAVVFLVYIEVLWDLTYYTT